MPLAEAVEGRHWSLGDWVSAKTRRVLRTPEPASVCSMDSQAGRGLDKRAEWMGFISQH